MTKHGSGNGHFECEQDIKCMCVCFFTVIGTLKNHTILRFVKNITYVLKQKN